MCHHFSHVVHLFQTNSLSFTHWNVAMNWTPRRIIGLWNFCTAPKECANKIESNKQANAHIGTIRMRQLTCDANYHRSYTHAVPYNRSLIRNRSISFFCTNMWSLSTCVLVLFGSNEHYKCFFVFEYASGSAYKNSWRIQTKVTHSMNPNIQNFIFVVNSLGFVSSFHGRTLDVYVHSFTSSQIVNKEKPKFHYHIKW